MVFIFSRSKFLEVLWLFVYLDRSIGKLLLASLVTKSDDQFLVYMQWAKDVDAVGCFFVAMIAKKERREKFSLLWVGRGAHLKSQKRPWAGSYLSGPLPLFYHCLICSGALECIVCVREWHLMQRSPHTLVLQSHSQLTHPNTIFLYLWGSWEENPHLSHWRGERNSKDWWPEG